MLLDGFTPYKKKDVKKYNKLRWWAGLTFGDLVDKAADIYPDKEAFVDGRGRFTFSQMRERINRFAISLTALGIEPLERVLVQLPNWNEFICAYFAIQKIGAIPVLLIDRYRQYEINHLLKLTGATSWIVPQRFKKVDYLPIISDVLKEHPQIAHVILVRGKSHESLLNMEKLIEDGEPTEEKLSRLAERRPDPMQVAHMAPTGGTTGLPKVVPHTHNNYLCRVEYVARRWELNSQDSCLAVAPIGHDLIFVSLICSTIFTFGKIVMLDSTQIEDICRTIQCEKISAVVWVPTLAQRVINFDRLHDYDLSSLRKMYCSGGQSSASLIKTVVKKLGCIYLNGYGGTEGMITLTGLNDHLDTVCRTVGKPVCPYDHYKIVDSRGREQPLNTPGQLLVKGPCIFTGYYGAPEENLMMFDRDGYFRTGDVARIDEAGSIILTGRIREMINRGGESINATEIENLICDHPGVLNVAVIPMPDPDMGERVCAYIQTKPGLELTSPQIISFLKGKKTSVIQLPEHIEFVNAFPCTGAGKIDKKALVEDLKFRMAAE